MSYVLYYSNTCDKSIRMLQELTNMHIQHNPTIHYICTDKKQHIDGKTYVILENGDNLILPPCITQTPALMILTENFKVVHDAEIYHVLKPLQIKELQTSTNNNMGPVSYQDSLSTTTSSNFSFFDKSDNQTSWSDSYTSIIDPSTINSSAATNQQK